jgi:hypothetical protein
MLPLIQEGDRLLVSHDLATLRRGSVVLFWQEGRLIAHRLLRILPTSPPRFVTKGDNSWAFDGTVTAGDLLGHVLTIQRNDHRIVLDSRKWQSIGWLIATATLAVALPYGALRRVKQRLGGHKMLPGGRVLRRSIHTMLTTLLRAFAPPPQGSLCKRSERVDHTPK